jgi:hypothetical protein
MAAPTIDVILRNAVDAVSILTSPSRPVDGIAAGRTGLLGTTATLNCPSKTLSHAKNKAIWAEFPFDAARDEQRCASGARAAGRQCLIPLPPLPGPRQRRPGRYRRTY